jgi:hypothetical protein
MAAAGLQQVQQLLRGSKLTSSSRGWMLLPLPAMILTCSY